MVGLLNRHVLNETEADFLLPFSLYSFKVNIMNYYILLQGAEHNAFPLQTQMYVILGINIGACFQDQLTVDWLDLTPTGHAPWEYKAVELQ